MTRKFSGKQNRYTKGMPDLFYKLASEGNLLTQIAHILEVQRESLLEWSATTDPAKRLFVKAFKAGLQACQAFHENRLNDMITGELKCSAKQIDAQIFLLKTQFAADWIQHEKADNNITIVNQLSDSDLNAQLRQQLMNPNTRTILERVLAPPKQAITIEAED